LNRYGAPSHIRIADLDENLWMRTQLEGKGQLLFFLSFARSRRISCLVLLYIRCRNRSATSNSRDCIIARFLNERRFRRNRQAVKTSRIRAMCSVWVDVDIDVDVDEDCERRYNSLHPGRRKALVGEVG